jgi:cytochrome P450
LLDSDLPAPEKTLERLRFEGASIVSAGIETTRWVLSVATFHVLDQPEISAKLKKEVHSIWPDNDTSPSLSDLEKLPYLSAVIQEGKFLPIRSPWINF